jgi:hypothetical protein
MGFGEGDYTVPKNQNPEVPMCPVCLATAVIIAGSATGTGGLTALVATRFRRPKPDQKIPITQQEVQDGYDNSASFPDRLPRRMD